MAVRGGRARFNGAASSGINIARDLAAASNVTLDEISVADSTVADLTVADLTGPAASLKVVVIDAAVKADIEPQESLSTAALSADTATNIVKAFISSNTDKFAGDMLETSGALVDDERDSGERATYPTARVAEHWETADSSASILQARGPSSFGSDGGLDVGVLDREHVNRTESRSSESSVRPATPRTRPRATPAIAQPVSTAAGSGQELWARVEIDTPLPPSCVRYTWYLDDDVFEAAVRDRAARRITTWREYFVALLAAHAHELDELFPSVGYDLGMFGIGVVARRGYRRHEGRSQPVSVNLPKGEQGMRIAELIERYAARAPSKSAFAQILIEHHLGVLRP